ncbi:2-dehydropantoate 2-reductase [Halteromyces radiatus]|uniref:2-dehydropantoate 2-reductase n=1 Tax=Halteromyces radiatus TaxID=101107 RepID=UPI00221F3CF7|nr:2-dehydropantoate 2-reductase [Halteromyces radiatus]KAI8098884.1 2-dehydropantoate 2-reductase [Halteromyces radiatus]
MNRLLCRRTPLCGKFSDWTIQKITPSLGYPKLGSPFFSSSFGRTYSTMSPSVLTVGTGAIGAIYSWRLSKSAQVTTVCRSNYSVVNDNGFSINSVKFGQENFKPHHVVKTVSEAVEANNGAPFDYVLVTMKALPEVYNVADIIAPAVTPGQTTIVLIQNGLGVEEPIVENFPDNPLVSIVAYIGTSQTSPGHISMVGKESLAVGTYLPSKVDSSIQKQSFIDLLLQGGVDAMALDDIERIRWQKLFWNASFSPVCALTGMNTSELLANKEALTSVKSVMKEVILAANAMGYDFDVDEQVKDMIERTEATAMNYKPSMQLDLERKQPMEVEVILGTPLRRAKAKGLHVPHLELMHDLLSATNAKTMIDRKSQL